MTKYGENSEKAQKLETEIDNEIWMQSNHDKITRQYLTKEWQKIHKEANGDFDKFCDLANKFKVTAGCIEY